VTPKAPLIPDFVATFVAIFVATFVGTFVATFVATFVVPIPTWDRTGHFTTKLDKGCDKGGDQGPEPELVAQALILTHPRKIQSDKKIVVALSFCRARTICSSMFHEAEIWDGRQFQRKVLA
jgi:hypothetical protein